MIVLCIKFTDINLVSVVEKVFNITSTVKTIYKKCLIYFNSDKSLILLVFTHLVYRGTIDLIGIDRVALKDCVDEEFYYSDMIPKCDWNKYIYPFDFSKSYVTDLSALYKFLVLEATNVSNIISYVPNVDLSEEIIAKIKYISRDRLDNRSYDILQLHYPDIKPVVSTIPELREMTNYNNLSHILQGKPTIDMAAFVITEYLSFRIVCTCVTTRTFYIFTDMWYMDQGHAYINRVMMYDIYNYLVSEVNVDDNRYVLDQLYNIFNNFRRDIIERLCHITESKSFTKLLDNKTNVICMLDGLYDFDHDEFRSVRPSDYISISANVDYLAQDLENRCMLLRSILSNFFSDVDVMEFFLSTVALALGGRNFEKIVVIWVGRTDSGKSTCQEFIENVLGDYCGSIPSSMLVGKRSNPHATTSALSSIGKKRLLFLQEPEESRINSSQLKSLSGNDSIYTREIYEKGTTMRISAITTIVTNGRMDFSTCDEAALSRIVVIPFTSKFVTSRERHKHLDNVNIVEADPNIGAKLKELGTPMMRILIDKYREYKRDGYIIPHIIREYIDRFISDSNPTLYYMRHFTEPFDGARVLVTTYFSLFSSWYKETYPGNRLIPLYTFKETLISSGYSLDKDYVVNYRLISL